jgi:DNA-directed RNA polymerase specialized sigma subunit
MKTLPLNESIPDGSLFFDDLLKREVVISLLARRIDQLSAVPRKILAMHYHEKMPLSEIAACLNLTECYVCQIHAQTVDLVHEEVLALRNRFFHQKIDTPM